MGLTPVLEFPYPDGTESADGPGALQALAERAEALGLYTETDLSATRQPDGSVLLELNDGVVTADHLDPYAVHSAGDFKESAQTASHGRWLLCDVERDMSSAEIVAECPGLGSGDADLLATLLGTGASSQYGTAVGGKVKIPGYAGKFAIHPSASHPKKGTGSTGGEESHTLTAAEAPLKAHGHGVTDNGHGHPGSSQAPHGHVIDVYDPQHHHDLLLALNAKSRFITTNGGFVQAITDTDVDAAHTFGFVGGSTNDKPTGITAAAENAQPAVTVADHVTGLTVNNAAGADAAAPHNNLPPYRVGGNRFMYV